MIRTPVPARDVAGELMGIVALTHDDLGRMATPTDDVEWNDWVSDSETHHHLLDAPVVSTPPAGRLGLRRFEHDRGRSEAFVGPSGAGHRIESLRTCPSDRGESSHRH